MAQFRNALPVSGFTNHDDLVEAARLANKTQLLLRSLGGFLPGAKPHHLKQITRVLEVACGPGTWALELARTYPQMRVVAVDSSSTMISYARNILQNEPSIENVAYQMVPTYVGPFDFPEASFDLVSVQFISKFLQASDWPRFLTACRSLLRPGGLIRLTEYDLGLTNSPAQEELNRLFVQAMRRAGYSPSVSDSHLGLLNELEPMLYAASFQECSTVSHHINYSFGAPAYKEWKEDYLIVSKQVIPFMLKWGAVSQEQLDDLYQQQYIEMSLPTFHAVLPFLTIWGSR